jgi:hypothetical protein
MRHAPGVRLKKAGDTVRKPIAVPDPLIVEIHDTIDFVSGVLPDLRKKIFEFFDEGWSEFFIGIQPKDPGLGGEFEMLVPGFRKALPRSALNLRTKVPGNLNGVVGAAGVEDEPLFEGSDLTQASGEVFCFVEAKSADGDGEGLAHPGQSYEEWGGVPMEMSGIL